MNSKELNGVEQQPLALGRHRVVIDAGVEASIAKCRDLLAAINLCMNLSGLEDKEIYAALDIDPGHFSHIRRGKAGVHFPTNKLNDLMDLCGNEIPLIWLAGSRQKGLHMLESEMERQLREERAARLEAEGRVRVLQEAISGHFPTGSR